jgi:hypothetical protein
MYSEVRRFRVFISSPSDVADERSLVVSIIERLNGEFKGEFEIARFAYEERAYSSNEDFQSQIVSNLEESDLVIGIFWWRAGTPLTLQKYQRDDGSRYESGSIYEVESAWKLCADPTRKGKPDVVLCRKTADYFSSIDGGKRHEQERQVETLNRVLDGWTKAMESSEDVESPVQTIKRAWTEFKTETELEQKLEFFIRGWLQVRGYIAPPWTKGSPFPGLAPYTEEFGPVFFGRTEDARVCRNKLREASRKNCAFLLIVGASGAGKSSLARAGLTPFIAVPGSMPGVEKWYKAVMRPGQDPLRALADQLSSVFSTRLGNDIESWQRLARRDPKFATGSIQTILAPDERVLLLVDQLEEAFSVSADGFSAALSELARSGKAVIVATLRSDQYSAFQRDPILLALKDDGSSYDLRALGEEDFRQIIQEPILKAGKKFEHRDRRDLGEEILASATGADALPLVQMILARLYERDHETGVLTFRSYEAMGKIEGAITEYAEDVIKEFPDPNENLRFVLTRLARAGEDSQILSQPLLTRDLELEGHAEREKLVSAMINARLLISDGDQIRLAHEALLRTWQRAKAILNEEAFYLRLRDELLQRAKQWDVHQRSDEFLLPPNQILSDAESNLDKFRAEKALASLVEFIEISLERRREGDRQIQVREAADSEKIRGLLKAREFNEALQGLEQLIEYLRSRSNPDAQRRASRYEGPHARVLKVVDFFSSARRVWMLAGEEDFENARLACERALASLRVFEDPGWIENLPVEVLSFSEHRELHPIPDSGSEGGSEQAELLRQEAYRQLLLYSALQLVPGIRKLFPEREESTSRRYWLIDPKKLLQIIPRSLLTALIKRGGFGPFKLPGRQDVPEAVPAFQRSLDALSQARKVEEWRAAEKGVPHRSSRTSHFVSNIVEILRDFALGPKGARIDFARLFPSVSAERDRPEPVNAADYFFVALLNYFVAKRGDDAVIAKAINLLQGIFPDLDDQNPFGRAERLLRSAIALDASNYWPHWLLGRTLQGRDDPFGAELAFNSAILLDQGYARGYEQRALSLASQWVKTKDRTAKERALGDLDHALEVAGGDPSIFWPRGEALLELREIDSGLDSFARWLELEEDILGLISRSAGVARLHNQVMPKLLRRDRLEMDKFKANAHAVQALVYFRWSTSKKLQPPERESHSKNALREADEGLQIDPKNTHAATVKGLILEQQQQHELALQFLTDAVDNDPLKANYLAALRRLHVGKSIPGTSDVARWRDDFLARANQSTIKCPEWMLKDAQAVV